MFGTYKKLAFVFILGTAVACTEAENGNQDSASEVSCSSATGSWVISAATCDSATQTIDPISLTFNSSTSITQVMGTSACATAMAMDVLHGSFDNGIRFTGNGNAACSVSGSTVPSCTSASNSCDATTDVTGMFNQFETCAISGGTEMTLIRTVSSTNNPDDMSFCSNGAVEVITLTKAATDPTGPAVLSIAGADPHDFGSVSNGSSSNHTFTVSNSGGVAATSIAGSGLAAPYTFLGGVYPGTGGDCAATLAAGASCSIVVRFSPVATGAYSDSIQLDYNDGSAAQSLSHGVQGSGTAASLANLTISDANPYDYGTKVVGSTTTHMFTLSNTGSDPATALTEIGLASPFGFSGGAYPGTGGNCGATLAAGGSCNIGVEFAPVATGLASDSIVIQYNNGVVTTSVSRQVQGTGVAPAVLFISDGPTYDFGVVSSSGGSSSHIFTVTNAGGFNASGMIGSGLAAPFNFTGGAYPGAGGTCVVNLAPGNSCTIDVVFSPLALGVMTDTIQLPYFDGASAQSATRDVQGTGN